MWLKTEKEHVDKMDDFKLGELYADLENASLAIDGIFDKYFVGKEVSDSLQSMVTYLNELSREIKDVENKRKEAKK